MHGYQRGTSRFDFAAALEAPLTRPPSQVAPPEVNRFDIMTDQLLVAAKAKFRSSVHPAVNTALRTIIASERYDAEEDAYRIMRERNDNRVLFEFMADYEVYRMVRDRGSPYMPLSVSAKAADLIAEIVRDKGFTSRGFVGGARTVGPETAKN